MVQDMAADILPETPNASHHKQPGAQPQSSPSSPTGTSPNNSYESSMDSLLNKDEKVSAVAKAVRLWKKARNCGITTSEEILTPLSHYKRTSDSRVIARISVSQTSDGETTVHTDSLNFRQVVHQLTGTSSHDKELLPLTLPVRYVNRVDVGSKQQNAVKVEIGGTRTIGKSVSSHLENIKLHERRKTMKHLDKLTTIYKEVPAFVPNPISLLASDFGKFCLPAMPPTANEGNLSFWSSDAPKIVVEDGMRMEEQIIAEELEIAEKGFYLHSKRPRKGDLTLLNLFPESPVCSPPKK